MVTRWPPLVEMRGIVKRYGGVRALDGAGLVVYADEVHALVGDNAAGKSTLIKVLSGAVAADAGEVRLDGRPVHLRGPRDAKALGIETVYQDLALADNLDVPANIFLGRERLRAGGLLLDHGRMEREARALLDRLRIRLPHLGRPVRVLSGGQRQCVAIARSMAFNARLVILDEPTASLGVAETAEVHALVRDLRAHGVAVLMISHNLTHVFGLADRVTVMKAGQTVGSRRTASATHEDVIRMIMTGVDGAAAVGSPAESSRPNS